MTEPAYPPPPMPSHAPGPPPKKGLSTLAIVLIVVGVLGIFCIAGLIGTVVTVVQQMQNKQHRLTCQQNLSQLATIFVMKETDDPDAKLPPGPALLLQWQRDGAVPAALLRCPEDQAKAPGARATSYAVRDFGRFPLPLAMERKDDEPIAACLHHKGGVIVAFDNGRVRFMEWSELGVANDAEIVVGPDSRAPVLRKLCFTPGVTEK